MALIDQKEVDKAQDVNTNPRQESDENVAENYEDGELAPYICTGGKKLWKPDDLKKANATVIGILQTLIETCAQTDEAARRFAILQVWQARHFDVGYQNLTEAYNGGWGIGGTNIPGNKNSIAVADTAGVYPTNVYSAQGDIITGALNRGTIKVNFSPVKSKDPQDVICSDAANKYKHIWAEANNSADLQKEISGLFWTDPAVVVWTRSVKDKQRFGTVINENGEEEIRVVEVSSPFGVLECKLPMMPDKLSQMTYAQLFQEVDYAECRTRFPWMGNKIKPSWGSFAELEFERIARINTRIGIVGRYLTGTSGIRETTVSYNWFRPGMFADDRINDETRDFLRENFPTGIIVVCTGKEIACCWEESMDDHLTLGMATRGFGQNRRSLGTTDIPIQKRINNWADLYDKFVRTAIPQTLLDDQAFNAEAINDLKAAPGRFIPVSVPEGTAMTNLVGQTPAPVPLPGFEQMFQYWAGPLIQQLDGGTPALNGQGEGADNTVGATQIRLNQSLERVGPPWMTINRMFEEAIGQAVKCCAENNTSEIYANIDGIGELEVNPSDLKGNFKCQSESTNELPESGVQRQSKVIMVLDMAKADPQVASLIATPSNAREIVKALHIDDVITIDEAEWEDYALENIKVLLDSEPNINPEWQEMSIQLEALNQTHEAAKQAASVAVQSGNVLPDETIQQGQMLQDQIGNMNDQLNSIPKYLPSIDVAQDESEDHSTIAATVLSWMATPEGRNIKRKSQKEQEGGPNWNKWMNVYLYWQGHKEMVQKLISQNQQPVPPKMSLSGKLDPTAINQLLAAAGIQVNPNAQPTPPVKEIHEETINRSPYAERKSKIIRKI